MNRLEGKYIIVILMLVLVSGLTFGKKRNRCEKIKIPFCKGLGYNTTIFPNNLNHDTQEEAKKSAKEFSVLVETECSAEIALFLCSLYVPVCTQMHKALPPCRTLCQNSRSGCELLMNRFGYKWPDQFSCEKFPRPQDGLCVGRNSSTTSHKLKPGKKMSVHKIRQKKCAKESEEGKLCCKLGRRAAKKGYYCNLRKKQDDNSRKVIKFRKQVIRKCSMHTSCFRSCCEVYQRKRRSNKKRNAKRKERKQ